MINEEHYIKDSHCGFCGDIFHLEATWPKHCMSCKNLTYKNPIPVVVAIIPVHWRGRSSQCGWLIEQRGIEPKKGGWALPGGFVNFGETWQQAIVRELQEEVGLETKESDFKLFDIVTVGNGNMLIFVTHKGVNSDQIKFEVNHEVMAVQYPILPNHLELCFPSHNEMWAKFYDSIEG